MCLSVLRALPKRLTVMSVGLYFTPQMIPIKWKIANCRTGNGHTTMCIKLLPLGTVFSDCVSLYKYPQVNLVFDSLINSARWPANYVSNQFGILRLIENFEISIFMEIADVFERYEKRFEAKRYEKRKWDCFAYLIRVEKSSMLG